MEKDYVLKKGKNISGISTVVWLDASDALLQTWIHLAKNIYLDSNENDRKGQPAADTRIPFYRRNQKKVSPAPVPARCHDIKKFTGRENG